MSRASRRPRARVDRADGVPARAADPEPERHAPRDRGHPPGLGAGQPLVGTARAPLESALGASLAHVRVHTDAAAAQLAAREAARAVTVGEHIVFAQGAYRPDTLPGQLLLAHEAAHALQQRGAAEEIAPASDGASARLEGEADRASVALAARAIGIDAGRPSLSRTGLRMQRCGADGRAPRRGADIAGISVAPGKQYTVTADDLADGAESGWEKIARAHGMSAAKLKAFNTTPAKGCSGAKVHSLKEGTTIYIPSAQELALEEARKQTKTDAEAEEMYKELAAGPNLKVLEAAMKRASGERGTSYGQLGIPRPGGKAGPFLTPNPALKGARDPRVIEGQKEYQVNWNPDFEGFWKCSAFMQDVLYQAGYEPHMLANAHYQVAGAIQESENLVEIPVEKAGPGAVFQRFGGRGADESHNAILTSYVSRRSIDDTWEEWTFGILGAEHAGAGESVRTHKIKKGTNENEEGKKIRFFLPSQPR